MNQSERSAIWAEVLGAVEFLSQSERLGVTVWDALDEAIRLWAAEWFDATTSRRDSWSDLDPLRTSMETLLRCVASGAVPGGEPLGAVLSAALELWLGDVRDQFNQGYPFSRHPWADAPSIEFVDMSTATSPSAPRS